MTSHERIALLLADAALLQDRCNSHANYSSLTSGDDLCEARLARWIRNAARDNIATFEKRLAWDGWSMQEIRGTLASTHTDPAPRTAEDLLRGALERFASGASGESRPIPFAQVFDAFVREGSSHIAWDAQQLIGEHARRSWEDNLGYCLSQFAAHALYGEFESFRSQFGAAGAFDRFVSDLRAGGLLCCFERMPVIARLMCTVVLQWVAFVDGFLDHLRQDYELLQQKLGAAGIVADVTPGLSDRHCGGKTVVRVVFENGCACYYKPRNCEAEYRWNQILERLNETALFPEFYTMGLVAAENRGWLAEVPWKACSCSEEVVRFHQRAGALLALLYCMGATDCHPENLIASGEHPVPIDMETLTTPRVCETDFAPSETAFDAVWTRLRFNSVLATGMLPQSATDDLSGLPVRTPDATESVTDQLADINSDRMRMERRPRKRRGQPNAVILNGAPVSSCDYAAPVAQGFEEMYRFLMSHRDTFPGPDGLPGALRGVPFRMLYRPTRVYELVCRGMLNPGRLRSGIDAGIELEVLSRALLHSETRPPFWPILAAEQQAIGCLDIPMFYGNTSSDSLTTEDGTAIAGFFAQSGVELIRSRLAGLSEYDLHCQSDYIHASLGRWRKADPAVYAGTEIAGATTADLLAEAVRIGDAIVRAAVRGADGTACWVATEKEADYRMEMKPMGPHLYDGCAGPALFLSALANVTGDPQYRDTALAAFRSLNLLMASLSGPEWLAGQGIGGCFGAPSMAYALAHGSVLLDAPGLLAQAEQAIDTVARMNLDAEMRANVFNGLAGAILCAIAVHRLSPKDHLLEFASACGRRLLALRQPALHSLRVWPVEERSLTGLSYGAAGIAYALSALSAATGVAEFRDAAAEACAYERSTYSSEVANWPDFRASADAAFPFAMKWCHGAPGIALCRIGSLAALDTPDIRADIDAGLCATLSAPPASTDVVCCGELGRAEVLLFAAARLGRPELLESARRIAARSVSTASAPSGYRTIPAAGPCHADFHRGLAGIGYALLRLSSPNRLPSVLAWE